ncbi:MAG: beta-ketoacyl-[acyl-carrier-protein] synthase family protein [Chthoniobacterales bacterium]
MNKRNRVVITGMGIMAPNGIGIEPFWESLLAGRSGIGPITLFDATGFKTRIAGEVKNFDPLDYIEPELKPKRMARHTQLAYAATMMALEDAGLNPNRLEVPSPTPVVIGISTSAIDVIESVYFAMRDHGPNRAPASSSGASIPSAAASFIADRLGTAAHATTVSSACPSGLDAVADAVAMIRDGSAEFAIAGGADAPITPLTMASFIGSGLCSGTNGEPDKASRPFDVARDCGVLSEGACVFVLENSERAAARSARPYLEICGYAKRRDIDVGKPASGLIESMKLALANAQCRIEDIDYISAYGTSDRILDAAEANYVKEVFGLRAYAIPISSIKGVTGNPLAAGGPLQLAACALTIRDQILAPTTNFEQGDEICDLDFVPNRPRKKKVGWVLINVRGLGGSASSMVAKRI